MSKAVVRIPAPLRSFTGGAGEVDVEATTVARALQALDRRHAGILDRVLDGDGRVRGFVNIYVGETNVKQLGGLDTALAEQAIISIVPAVAGGVS